MNDYVAAHSVHSIHAHEVRAVGASILFAIATISDVMVAIDRKIAGSFTLHYLKDLIPQQQHLLNTGSLVVSKKIIYWTLFHYYETLILIYITVHIVHIYDLWGLYVMVTHITLKLSSKLDPPITQRCVLRRCEYTIGSTFLRKKWGGRIRKLFASQIFSITLVIWLRGTVLGWTSLQGWQGNYQGP